MTALREQAYNLVDAMPEGDLCLIVDILEAFRRNGSKSRNMETKRKPFDFSKYMGRGKKLFSSTEEIDKYVKESRSDRAFLEPEGKDAFVASRFGVASGKFVAPNDIDFANDEIADLFEGNV